MTYDFLQHYWCFIVAFLGGLLVSMFFVQGINAVAHSLGYTEKKRRPIYNSIGRKWVLTFAVLVMFGIAFFASFPMFFSVSFDAAYLLWAILLFTFVLQLVSSEFQYKVKNPAIFQFFLTLNGYIGPILLGCLIATFFEGAEFIVEKSYVADASVATPVSIRWENTWHGLDSLVNPWVLVFSVDIFFLSRILGILYLVNKLTDEEIRSNGYGRLIASMIHFVVLFLIFFVHLLLKEGYAYNESGFIYMEQGKYLANFTHMWYLSVTLLAGLALVLYGTLKTVIDKTYLYGISPAGMGAILIVMSLMLFAMWNGTAFYPSSADLQSSLTIANSCGSEFTLRTMFYASLPVILCLVYGIYRWWAVSSKKLYKEENKEI